MGLFKLNAQAHPATVTLCDRSKISKERMIARIESIKNSLALDKHKNGGMSEEKKRNLKSEVKSILSELGARDEALNEIVEKLVNN